MNLLRAKFFGRVGLGIVLGAFVLYGCTRDDADFPGSADETVVEGRNAQLTRDAAQAWYEGEFQPVEPLNGPATKAGGLILVTPRWDLAEEFKHGHQEVVQVPIVTPRLGAFVDKETKEAIDRDPESMEVANHARLVVLKDLKTGETISFVMIFMGSFDYRKKHKDPEILFQNNYFKRVKDFTGDVLYFDLGKGFAGGWRYNDGKITDRTYPVAGDESGGFDVVPTKACSVVLTMYWNEVCTHTSLDGGVTWRFNGCQTSAVWFQESLSCDGSGGSGNTGGYPGVPPPPGGGNGGGTPPSGLCPVCNTSPCVCPTEVNCDDVAAMNTIGTHFTHDLFMDAGLIQFINQYRGQSMEHGTTLNYDVTAGSYEMDAVTHASPTNPWAVNIPYYDDMHSLYTVASVHTHPGNEPPSAPDALSLANRNDKTHGECKTSFIVTADGTLYALYVEDASKAATFFRTKNNQALRDMFMERQSTLITEIDSQYSGDTSGLFAEMYMYAYAYLLDDYNSGIRILRLEGSRFVQKTAFRNGMNKIIRQTCK